MPTQKQPMDKPDAMAERILHLERQRPKTKLPGPRTPPPEILNPYAPVVVVAGNNVTDHGVLAGLADNDHPQYLLATATAADSDKLDGSHASAFATAGHNHNTTYLGISAKAADSELLDNHDTAYFATADHDHIGEPVIILLSDTAPTPTYAGMAWMDTND